VHRQELSKYAVPSRKRQSEQGHNSRFEPSGIDQMLKSYFLIKVDGKPVRLSINLKTRQRSVVPDALGYDTFKSVEAANTKALLYGLVDHAVVPVVREVEDCALPA
jgi:hypothetical protein